MIRTLMNRLLAVSTAMSVLAFASLVTGLPALSSGWISDARMSAGACLLALLCVAAIFLEARANAVGPRRFSPARLLAALALLVSGDALLHYAIAVATGSVFDGYIFGPAWGRLTSATALCFTLLAGALVLPRTRISHCVYSAMLALAAGSVLVSLVGYGYGARAIFSLRLFSDMSLSAALTLSALLPAALLLRPDCPWTRLLVARTQSGQTARMLIAISVILPFLTSEFVRVLQAKGWLVEPIAFAVNAVANVVILSTLSLILSAWLYRSERARRKTERLVDTIVENTPAMIFVKDFDGRYLLVNREFCNVFGLKRDQLIGRTDADLFSQAEAAAYGATDLLAMNAVDGYRLEETIVRNDEARSYLTLKSPMHDDDGAVVGMFGISSDITDRKRAEKRLATKLERLKLLDGITRSVNRQSETEEVFALAVAAIEVQLPADFVCVCRYDSAAEVLKTEFSGVHATSLAESLGLGKNTSLPVGQNGLWRCISQVELVYEPDILGVDFPFTQILLQHGMRSVVLSPLPIEGKAEGLLIVARRDPNAFLSTDCEFLKQLGEHVALATHQTKLRASLQRAYEDLKQSQQAVIETERLSAIGQMASGIAHDINNAISPVSVYTQSLLERDLGLPQEVMDYLETVNGVVQDLTATVTRMRDFYRPTLAESELASVDLNALVRQVVEHTRARWRDMPLQRGVVITVATELQASLPMISGIASELREMMTNLVFNAVDAMPDGGTITLRTAVLRTDPALPRRVQLEVVDTGIGMDEATRKRCLDPFFTTKGERGTGLGLAMVYGAAQRHQGQIDIRSAPGAGTTFGLQFVAAEGLVTEKEASVSRPTRALRLLLVDDDPSVLRSNRLLLERDGHVIVVTDNGQDGIDAVKRAVRDGMSFDAVITDLGMPYVDGNQVAKAVKAYSPGTVVILLTGWGRRMGGADEDVANIDFVLAKPFRLAELRAALAQVEQRRF